MTDLAALIARLEAANYGTHALDRAIWDAVIPPEFLHADDRPPAFTVSIDAALTLIPAEDFWKVGHDGEGPNAADFLAVVLPTGRTGQRARHATPALALVVAALKARLP